MTINEKICGFIVREVRDLPELRAKMVRMEYEKNGAELVWLDREDDNKTFAITFKTIPQDDTGVFHILEHSVLCGSRKYPVKEPFVELLKSSMNTFLNAFTFPDKTMYPVCSRNNQDFLNLVDVYLDAVLHPLSITDPHAFLQEGWHYEMTAQEDALTINGVVYNEMKGAFASSDTVLQSELDHQLFPDICYGYVSGGHPDHIPELTYENYLASHGRFYHPSNARIFLDGSIDTAAVLGKLDEVLSEYDRLEMDTRIPMQKPVHPKEHICHYEIGEEEDASNKAILCKGYVFGDFAQPERVLAASMLGDVLCGSNEAPMMLPLLEQGLAEDGEFSVMDGIQQPYVLIVLRNVRPENKERAWAVVETALRDAVKNGLDHDQLRASLDSMEFANREKEYGMPAGLVYGINAMESWLYGGDPAQNLVRGDVFAFLREGIENGWFERFLEEVLDSTHQATVTMLPSTTLGSEKREAERVHLAALKERKGDNGCREIIETFQSFRQRQEVPDTPEQLATLPVLSLADVPEEYVPIPQNIDQIGDVIVLHQPQVTDGIVHLELFFDLSDVPMERLHEVKAMSQLIGQVATARFGVMELRSELGTKFGRFGVNPVVHSQKGVATPYLLVQVSLLESRKADAAELLNEVLNHSSFEDSDYIFHYIQQSRMELEQNIISSGNSYAAIRLASAVTKRGAVNELLHGITHLRWLQETEKDYENCSARLREHFAELTGYFSRERVTVSVTGELDREWVGEILSVLGTNPIGERTEYPLQPVRKEGFIIPAEIGFAAKLGSRHQRVHGAGQVAAQMLSYGHLWTEVRVKGGAYGTGLGIAFEGGVQFTSYRDPNPIGSIGAFDASGAALREFCNSGEPVDRYIISTISSIDPLLTPRSKGALAAKNYLTGKNTEWLQRERSEVLHTTVEDLLKISEMLDEVCAQSGICVIGGKNVLDACSDMLETVESIQ